MTLITLHTFIHAYDNPANPVRRRLCQLVMCAHMDANIETDFFHHEETFLQNLSSLFDNLTGGSVGSHDSSDSDNPDNPDTSDRNLYIKTSYHPEAPPLFFRTTMKTSQSKNIENIENENNSQENNLIKTENLNLKDAEEWIRVLNKYGQMSKYQG